jgi:TonB family protein
VNKGSICSSCLPFVLAASLLWPVLCRAKDISLAEVGVDLFRLPDYASVPVVRSEPDGYEAVLRVGEALVVVYRNDGLVSAGTVATDESFRSSLTATPNLVDWPQSQGKATMVAGQPAWAAYRAYGTREMITYVLVVCVVSNAHAYLLQVSAHSPSKETKKPMDFDLAVQAVQNLRFVSVTHLVPSPPEALNTSGMRVRMRTARWRDFYPEPARRLHEQGEVDLEFRIDARGHAQDISETYAAAPDLGKSAQELIRTAVFDVPSDWVQRESNPLRMEVQFVLNCHGNCSYPPRIAGTQVMTVAAQFIR